MVKSEIVLGVHQPSIPTTIVYKELEVHHAESPGQAQGSRRGLEEVYQDDHWLPLEAWAAKYEPKEDKKEDSEFDKKIKVKIGDKAKETIFRKLQEGISAKLSLLILEVASRVLNRVEKKMVGTAKDLVNTASAIVLSYRFKRSKKMDKTKAEFFRKTALDQLTQLIDRVGDELSGVQKEMRERLDAVQNVRLFISDRLDEILFLAKSKSAEIEAKVETTADEAETLLKAAGIERPPLVPEKSQAQKDEIVVMMSAVIKEGLLTKLDTVNVTLSAFMDKLFVVATLANAKGKQMKDTGELRKIIGMTVEEMYSDMEAAVENEVSNVVLLIGSMTQRSEIEEKADE